MLTFTRSINIEYNASSDRCPRNLRFSYSPGFVENFPSSAKPSSMIIHHEMQPLTSSGSTRATRPSMSPWSSSRYRHRKSLLTFIPTINASSWSQRMICPAICRRELSWGDLIWQFTKRAYLTYWIYPKGTSSVAIYQMTHLFPRMSLHSTTYHYYHPISSNVILVGC